MIIDLLTIHSPLLPYSCYNATMERWPSKIAAYFDSKEEAVQLECSVQQVLEAQWRALGVPADAKTLACLVGMTPHSKPAVACRGQCGTHSLQYGSWVRRDGWCPAIASPRSAGRAGVQCCAQSAVRPAEPRPGPSRTGLFVRGEEREDCCKGRGAGCLTNGPLAKTRCRSDRKTRAMQVHRRSR